MRSTASSLQCPYHNWTFRLDGALVAAPGMSNVAEFDSADMCLHQFEVEVWQGWIFVNLSADASPTTLHRDFPGHRTWSISEDGEPWTWLDHESTNDELEPFAVVQVFPAHMFSINRGFGMDWIRVEALAVDLTRAHHEVFFEPDQTENQRPIAFGEMAAAVNSEDIEQLKRVQVGLASRWARTAPLSPLEEGCWHFRRWIVENSQTDPSWRTDD